MKIVFDIMKIEGNLSLDGEKEIEFQEEVNGDYVNMRIGNTKIRLRKCDLKKVLEILL